MPTLAEKLQLKPDQTIRVVGRPTDVDLGDIPTGSDAAGPLLVFASSSAALPAHLADIVASAKADRLTWVAYPKAGALGTDLNRDRLAAILTAEGTQPVRQVALDDTWSALRFRPG
jgi:hypothetical protein